MSVDEVRNRATVAGALEIGRLPGVVQVTLPIPVKNDERIAALRYCQKAVHATIRLEAKNYALIWQATRSLVG